MGRSTSGVRHKFLYTPFVVSPSSSLRLRTEPVEVTGLSNHGWQALKTLPFDWLRVNGKCKEALDALVEERISGLTRYRNAKQVMKQWMERFVERVDEAHGDNH